MISIYLLLFVKANSNYENTSNKERLYLDTVSRKRSPLKAAKTLKQRSHGLLFVMPQEKFNNFPQNVEASPCLYIISSNIEMKLVPIADITTLTAIAMYDIWELVNIR